MNLFEYEGRQLRTIEIDGEPWFVGADVLHCLGLRVNGASANHYLRLDADQRCKVKRVHLGCGPGRDMTAVSESGLYKLIMRADSESASPFQNWVTREVLPSIRRTGGYLLNEARAE